MKEILQQFDRKKWVFILIVSLLASIPLFSGCIYYGHDTLFHITRVEGLKASLLAGQFPVRISSVQFHEYGYISSALYPELLLYFPALLRLAGFSISEAYCIFWFCIHFLTALFSWWGFGGLTKNRAGAYTGTILFTLFPYRLISIYLRGAFGEALALTFFPLVLWGVYEIFYGDNRKWPVAVLGYCGILQSHILTITLIMLLSIFFGLYSIKCLWKDKRRIGSLMALAVSVLLLNLWFLVPFIILYRLPLWVKYSTGDFLEHVLILPQLFAVILRGSGNSLPLSEGTGEEMPFSIGLGLMVGLVCILVCWAKKGFKSKAAKKMCLVSLVISLFFYWTVTIYFPWKTINDFFPFFNAFMSNLPWRRLGLAGTFLIVAVCIAVNQYALIWQKKLFICLTVGCLISSGSFLFSYIAINKPYITKDIDYNGGTEDELYLYYGTDVEALRQRGDIIETSSDLITISNYKKYYTNITLNYVNKSAQEEWMDLPLNYYPGYVARDSDGKSLTVSDGDNHVLRVCVPSQSSGKIEIQYEECRMYQYADAVSVAYFLIFIVYLIWRKKNRKEEGRRRDFDLYKNM